MLIICCVRKHGKTFFRCACNGVHIYLTAAQLSQRGR